MLIEHPGGAGTPIQIPGYFGVRTRSEIYVEYENGEREYYDLRTDPLELENLAGQAALPALARLSARVGALKACQGASCRP